MINKKVLFSGIILGAFILNGTNASWISDTINNNLFFSKTIENLSNNDMIENEIKNKIKNLNVSSIKNISSTPFKDYFDFSKFKRMFLIKNENIALGNITLSDYFVSLKYSTIKKTKLNGIKLFDTGEKEYDINIGDNGLSIRGGKNIYIKMFDKKIFIIVDGKKVFEKEMSKNILKKKISNIQLYSNNKITFKSIKIKYNGVEKKEKLNKALIINKPKESAYNQTINDFQLLENKYVNVTKEKEVKWNPKKGLYEIKETQTIKTYNVNLPTELKLRLKEDVNFNSLISNFTGSFNGLEYKGTFNFDGDANTNEVIFKVTGKNIYYVYQIKKNGNDVDVIKIYKGEFDPSGLTDAGNLDGKSDTKEFYKIANHSTYIFQYANGKLSIIMYKPYVKIYFNNLLTKSSSSWKVLFGLDTETTKDGNKYYVKPIIRLYWYDENKNKYYAKQVKDYTNWKTFNIKLNGNYIYKKNNDNLDKNNTDYITE